MKTMRALVKSKAAPGLWLENVPVPQIGPDDVLIRTKKASICGTDIHIYNWDAWAQKTIPVPMPIGHEFVGEIAAVGSNVRGFSAGDLVVGEGHITCGHCRNCLAGRRHRRADPFLRLPPGHDALGQPPHLPAGRQLRDAPAAPLAVAALPALCTSAPARFGSEPWPWVQART